VKTRNIIIIIISGVIYVTKCNIKTFLAMIQNSTVIDCILLNRRMRFIYGCYVNNSSLQFIFNVIAKQELIKVIGLMGLGTVAYLRFSKGGQTRGSERPATFCDSEANFEAS